MQLTEADLARLPAEWTRAQFSEVLDMIRLARAVKYYRIMRPRHEIDFSRFATETNIGWNGEDRRTGARANK